MRLVDLNPKFLGCGLADGTWQEGVGVRLDCPCGSPDCLDLFVPFKVALDGRPGPHGDKAWDRTGDTFDTLTLSPSIQRMPVNGETCRWHGFIRNGEIVPA